MALVIVVIVIVAIVVMLGLMLLGIYNGLIRSRVRTQEAWSGIDVQLKRRADLVPNLVETVRGYAEHERGTFEAVTNARSMLQNAQARPRRRRRTTSSRRRCGRCSRWRRTTRRCGPARTSWPSRAELSDIEEKIAYARQFYNTNVNDFNARIQVMPNVFIANMMGLKPFEFFEAEEAAREVPRVSFQSTRPPRPQPARRPTPEPPQVTAGAVATHGPGQGPRLRPHRREPAQHRPAARRVHRHASAGFSSPFGILLGLPCSLRAVPHRPGGPLRAVQLLRVDERHAGDLAGAPGDQRGGAGATTAPSRTCASAPACRCRSCTSSKTARRTPSRPVATRTTPSSA